MIFLIEYDRDEGRIATIKSFANSEREWADVARFELEWNLHLTGIEHEVVLLEAKSQDALRQTHRRYFEDWVDLIPAPAV